MPPMRSLALVLLLAGCHDFPKHGFDAGGIDGGTTTSLPDAAMFCSSATGTADVTVDDNGTMLQLTHLDAGALLEGGAFASPPVVLSLLLVDVDPLDANTAQCCAAASAGCCPIDGFVATTGSLDAGTEVGDHAITVQRIQDATFSIPGTLTITEFVQPFDQAPGLITGAIDATAGQRTVHGSLSNTFCSLLLTTTI